MNIFDEDLMTLPEAARAIPIRRDGKTFHVSSLYRWYRHGIGGVRLECKRLGGRVVTTRRAIQTFFDALTNIHDGAAPLPDDGSLRRAEAAGEKLEENWNAARRPRGCRSAATKRRSHDG